MERNKIRKKMKLKKRWLIMKVELFQRRAEEIMIRKSRNVVNVKPMMIVGINVISRMMKSKLIVRHLNLTKMMMDMTHKKKTLVF